jgi:diguanylate cyclase (GGDEF)-like protein
LAEKGRCSLLFKVALCIGVGHDPWLVALAVLICSVGAFAIVQMFERARSTSGIQHFGWAFLTAIASGATIWCTHFVAMLAFRAGVPVTLDPTLTIASLAVAVTGTFVGITVAARSGRAILGTIGGAIYGAAISAMHYTGMAAYRVDGIVKWDPGYVATSIICSVLFAGAAFTVLRPSTASRNRVVAGTALIVTAIATLHFIAMTAMNIAPLSLSDTPLQPEDWTALAVATAFVGTLVIGAGVFAALIDRQTRSDAMRELAYARLSDTLTGLTNRAGFSAEFARRLEAARTTGANIALALIDLSRFKEINDVHGHRAGDAVLVQVAERIRGCVASGDLVGRLGGDAFAALIDFGEHRELTEIIYWLDEALKVPFAVGSGEDRIAAGIGVAVFPSDSQTTEMLFNDAELALSRAKAENAVAPRFYDAALDQSVRDRRELAADLAHAIERDQLDVHYQVQAKASTGEVIGFEALVRWAHPTRGDVSPDLFIPIAEQNGLILEIGEWVLRRACSDAARWPHGSKVAVNVSAAQLGDDLPGVIRSAMVESGLSPKGLEIELTETAIMADRQRALRVLRQVKALGIGVALDDFGTGYSSLETLRAFPFDKIKLDRLFVAELEGNAQSTAIIRAVVALGRSLSIPVLAEGVESKAQLDILLREGCDEIQGYLFGRAEATASIRQARISEAA